MLQRDRRSSGFLDNASTRGGGISIRLASCAALSPGDILDLHGALMWVANSSTLIYGERDAILVDTFLTTNNRRHN